MAQKVYEVYIKTKSDGWSDGWVEFTSTDLEKAKEKAQEAWDSMVHDANSEVHMEIREFCDDSIDLSQDNFGDSLAESGYKYKVIVKRS